MSYYYLISSLPTIIFGEKPYYSSGEFMDLCKAWIGKSQLAVLARLTLDLTETSVKNNFVKLWYKYEKIIRNCIVKNRAVRLSKDPTTYLKAEDQIYTYIERGVQEAFSATNPLEKEKGIDRLRWKVIDTLETRHFFDLEKLCAYKLRLLICEKWIQRKSDTGQKNLEFIFDSIYKEKDFVNGKYGETQI